MLGNLDTCQQRSQSGVLILGKLKIPELFELEHHMWGNTIRWKLLIQNVIDAENCQHFFSNHRKMPKIMKVQLYNLLGKLRLRKIQLLLSSFFSDGIQVRLSRIWQKSKALSNLIYCFKDSFFSFVSYTCVVGIKWQNACRELILAHSKYPLKVGLSVLPIHIISRIESSSSTCITLSLFHHLRL